MYSNERRSGFSVLELLVKIIFAALFVFLLIWLFKKNVPNMKPFYSNVFRENIKYMQEAGESYFTDQRMPQEIGKTAKITLSEMYDKKLILPFVDKDGNSCNQYESYVSITKYQDYYELKTNLTCNDESDYTIKILGCYTYCENGKCEEKKCRIEKIVQYQFKKEVSNTIKSYKCASGFKLDGKYCIKKELIKTEAAESVVTTTKTDVKPAKITIISGSKERVNTVVNKEEDTIKKVNVEPVKTYVPAVTKTEKSCHTTYETEKYSCNCTTYRDSNGRSTTTCDTCTKTIPVETCEDVTKTVSEGYYKYSCPSNATKQSGSGSSLKCWYEEVIKGKITYSCPSNSNYSEGSGASLKCYIVKDGSYKYSCESGYTLKYNKCYKTITGYFKEYKCDRGYTLNGTRCEKYSKIKEKAIVIKTTKKGYAYKWSSKSSIAGWKKTGKTRTVNGKEICE